MNFDPITGQRLQPPLPPRHVNPNAPYNPMSQAIAESEERNNQRIQEMENRLVGLFSGTKPQEQPYIQQAPAQMTHGTAFIPVNSADDAWKQCAGNVPFMAGEKLYFINEAAGEVYVTWFDAAIPKTMRKIGKMVDFEENDMPAIPQSETPNVLPYIEERLNGLESHIMDLKGMVLRDEPNTNTTDGLEEVVKPNARTSRSNGRSNTGNAGKE